MTGCKRVPGDLAGAAIASQAQASRNTRAATRRNVQVEVRVLARRCWVFMMSARLAVDTVLINLEHTQGFKCGVAISGLLRTASGAPCAFHLREPEFPSL